MCLRKLLIGTACFLAGVFLLNTVISRVSVINYKSFSTQVSFDRYVNEYFFLYNSYREHGSHDGPELAYGAEKIDPDHLDSAIGRSIGNEEYEGVISIDYDNLRVWRIGTVIERQLAASTTSILVSLVNGLALVGLWVVHRRKIKPVLSQDV